MFSYTKRRLVLIVLCLALAASACAADQAPRSIILLIGDGMGIGHVTAARCAGPGASGKLALDDLPVTGLVLTHPANALVTDSAAAGTALATGVKTTNGAISTDPKGSRLKTILELAREMGKSAGIVSTKFITDATPAVFISHVKSRGKKFDIADQMIESGIDVILGGGRRYFIPKSEDGGGREDGRDLLADAAARGFDVFDNAEAMRRSDSDRIIGLFAADSMTTQRPEPTLQEMTSKAISVLSRNPKGFFLMSEGGQIDSCAHGNDADGVVRQLLMFDDAVRAAVEFAQVDGSTLVIVTADHETGGMSVKDADKDHPKFKPAWVDGGHTANMVPLYAFGPGAQRFSGTHQNTDIPRICAKLSGKELN